MVLTEGVLLKVALSTLSPGPSQPTESTRDDRHGGAQGVGALSRNLLFRGGAVLLLTTNRLQVAGGPPLITFVFWKAPSHSPRGLANSRLSVVVFNNKVSPFKEPSPNPGTEFQKVTS